MITVSQTFKNISADKVCYSKPLLHPGFWVSLSFRIRRLRKFGPKYCLLLLPIDILIGFIRYLLSDTKIPSNINVGKGLYLPHPNGVIINDLVKIGSNVIIFQQVTIGEWGGKAPNIKNGAEIFGGAKVFGNISIGENSKIGANCVVSFDVESNSVVSTARTKIKPL